ncbi:MAG: prepilin-type N-terminal cleavage/methylation domain-containing protein [Gammaproteobacteria bacterium]|nr:prepilin-type N-terminal cleavage/methylation domain-containing protein [Gammaproteobacteria bacterium]
MLITRRTQQGFTITELMVAMAVGIVVLGGVLTVYLSTLRTSHTTLQATRLNQEMAAIMNIMVNDIRRAGFWGDADLTAPTTNPFATVDTATPVNTTALRVHSTDGTSYTDKSEEAVMTDRTGSCVTYSYDVDMDSTLDNEEKFGFRWDGQSGDGIMMRRSGAGGTNLCQNGGADTWESLTEIGTIEITNLTFSLADSTCLNSAEPDNADRDGDGTDDNYEEADCYTYPPTAGERTVESLRLLITLEAQLADDSEVQAQMDQTVQVRNYLVRAY